MVFLSVFPCNRVVAPFRQPGKAFSFNNDPPMLDAVTLAEAVFLMQEYRILQAEFLAKFPFIVPPVCPSPGELPEPSLHSSLSPFKTSSCPQTRYRVPSLTFDLHAIDCRKSVNSPVAFQYKRNLDLFSLARPRPRRVARFVAILFIFLVNAISFWNF